MNDHTIYPPIVVTVLRDSKPIAVIKYQQASDDVATADVLHPSEDVLPDVQEYLGKAHNAVGYLLWKLSGILPPPPDWLHDGTKDTDAPF